MLAVLTRKTHQVRYTHYYIYKAKSCDPLFELLLYVPVNSNGQVGTFPPFYGTFTQNEDVMTSRKCLKYNRLSKPIRLISVDGLT